MISQSDRLGIDLYQKQDYAGAEPELQAATRARPTWAEGWRYLGFCQYALAKHDPALASLEKAVALEPEMAETRYGLGLVRAAIGQTDEAIACFDECLRLAPNHSAAKFALIGGLVHRGQQRLEARDFEHGEADLERATKLDRKNPAAPVALANYFVAFGQDARAKKVVSDALGYITNDPDLNAFGTRLNVQASAAAASAAQHSQSRQVVHQSQEVPCPACKQPIMQWAVQCPHCGTQIKARPTSFDHLKGGPSTSWQEVAYYIVSVLWLLDGARPLLTALALSKSVVMSGMSGTFLFAGVLQICVAIGLLFRVEWLQFVAKIFCYIDLFFYSLGLIIALALHQWGGFAFDLVSASLTGLIIYLIGYMDG